MKRAGLWVGLLMLVGLSTACSSSSTLGGPEIDLISQVQHAPDLVRHSGTRRVESRYLLDGSRDALIYREEIQTDGQGHFKITPLGALQGGVANPSEFIAIQMIRTGFNQRYRDFLVRDLAAFLENYQLTSASTIVQVAGRDCLELNIARVDGSASYEVDLDVQTGLVLRYREFDAAGELYSMMEYETYDADPDLTGVVFHQPNNAEVPLVSADQLPFVPLSPKLLPDSAFTFMEATRITEPVNGGQFAKLTFTDGVETVFFIDGGPDSVNRPSFAPKAGVAPGYAGFSAGQGVELTDEVRVFHEGPLTVVWGNVVGHSIFIVGKAPKGELLDMLTSALP